jgi:hypothetical protein
MKLLRKVDGGWLRWHLVLLIAAKPSWQLIRKLHFPYQFRRSHNKAVSKSGTSTGLTGPPEQADRTSLSGTSRRQSQTPL